VKVSVANLANGPIAGRGDLASLLINDADGAFASLLKLGGSETGETRHIDGSQGKPGNRSQEKQKDESRPAPTENPKQGITSDTSVRQMVPAFAPTPWQLVSSETATASGDAGVKRSFISLDKSTGGDRGTSEGGEVYVAPSGQAPTSMVSDFKVEQPPDEATSHAAPNFDLNDSEQIRESRVVAGKSQDASGTVASSGDKGPNVSVTRSQPRVLDAAPLPEVPIGTGVPLRGPQVQPDSNPSAGVVPQKFSPQSHEVKLAVDGLSAQASAAEQLSDLHPIGGDSNRGEVKGGTATPLSDVVSGAFASAGGGRNQGNSSDAHQGAQDAKVAVTDDQVLALKVSPDRTSVSPDLGSLAHGNAGTTTPGRHEFVQPSTPDTQLKGLAATRIVDASATRLLGSAVRGDLRVGVQTEAFGRVTIQTNTQSGQLSAQLSLENAKESATLAMHLPAVEQKISQQHGLATSVRLVGGFDGGANSGFAGRDQSGSSRRDAEQYHGSVVMQPGGVEHELSNESRGMETSLVGPRYPMSSRLDVTV